MENRTAATPALLVSRMEVAVSLTDYLARVNQVYAKPALVLDMFPLDYDINYILCVGVKATPFSVIVVGTGDSACSEQFIRLGPATSSYGCCRVRKRENILTAIY
jgi:hypothetical protein